MARKVFTNDTNDQPQEQLNLLEMYVQKKKQLELLEKEVKELGNLVKTEMIDRDIKTAEAGGYRITKTESQRVTWKEDLLLAKVKSYNQPELIQMVEQVNMPVLEQYVLDGVIHADDLSECSQVTPVVTLRLSKIKEPVQP